MIKPTKQFLENMILACKKEQEKARENFFKQEGAIGAFQYMLEKQIYIEEGEKEAPDGMVNQEAVGGKE